MAMTRRRISSRTFSYSEKFRTSFNSIFAVVMVLPSSRLVGDSPSPRLAALPLSSNCHACGSSAMPRLELLYRQPIRLRQDANGVLGDSRGALADLQCRQRAVGGHALGSCGLDISEQRLGQLERQLVVFLFEPPGAVHPRALLDRLHLGAGEPEHVGGLGPEILGLEVA